ncbi:MAG TPA: dihydrofolate reductase family protein [Thermoleophilaceae bacterium]|nr:dihydrofolate reductase family protein [Thermoleophilaceae bacterium]
MAKLVVSQFMTVDGVVEDPGGAEAFDRGGWAFKFSRGDEGDTFKLDEVMSAEALLLGRVTYEGFAEAWPSREGDFADKFNTMPKYVVSSTLSDPDWNNSHVISGDLAGEVAAIKDRHDGDVLVNGSVQLCRALGELGLVDEYRLMIFPIILGSGKKLFDGTAESQPLRLTRAQPAGETLITTYEPASL